MKNIIIIEHNDPKEFLFEYSDKMNYSVYVVTNILNDKYKNYSSVKDVIVTNVYDIQSSVENILSYINKNNLKIDGVMTFSEDLVVLTADISEVLGCKSIGSAAARVTSCNKLAMRVKLSFNSLIKQPKFCSFNILNDQDESILRNFEKPCVIKPVFGIASHGVLMIENNDFNFTKIKDEVLSVVNENNRKAFKRFCGNMIVEEYIEGKMMSVDGFVQDGVVHIVGMLEFIMGEKPHFTQVSSYIPARTSGMEFESVSKYICDSINVLGFKNCPFHAEIRLTDNGPYLVEIAGRMAGGTIHKSYDKVYSIDMIDMMFKCMLGINLEYDIKQKGINYHCFYYPEINESKVINSITYPDVSNISEIYLYNKKAIPGYKLVTYPDMPNSVLEYACFAENIEKLYEIKKIVEGNIKITYV